MLNAEAAVRAALPVSCPADFNGDRIVNGDDLGMLLGSWGTPQYDINDDGTTDGIDLGIFLANWGPC
jgi:hypothetical protein